MSNKNPANDILGKILGLKTKAMYEKIKTGSNPKDTLLNRCLKLIESIQGLTDGTAYQKRRALDRAWVVYLALANMGGPERPDYDAAREESLSTIDKESIVISAASPDLRRGGLGYSQVGWGKDFVPSDKHGRGVWGDQFWQPKRAAKSKHRSLGKEYWAYRKEDNDT